MDGIGPLVSADWLVGELENPDLVICDVRWGLAEGPKRDDFAERRIAGARFVDLDTDLSAPAGLAGRHPLPTPDAFAEAMGRLGISNGSVVVAYDDSAGGLAAGRMWFMLDAIGVSVAVLDGGITEWAGPTESGSTAPIAEVSFAAVDWPSDSFAFADDIAAERDRGVALTDARSTERFVGVTPSIDLRPGHIPGALSMPWTNNVSGSVFADVDSLAEQFVAVGDGSIAYCGSGVTACHNLLAMRLVGKRGRLYAGSWSEWAKSDRPAETGTGL